MANILDVATGKKLLSEISKISIPAEYVGETISDIYGAWATEHGASSIESNWDILNPNTTFRINKIFDSDPPMLDEGAGESMANMRFVFSMYLNGVPASEGRVDRSVDLSSFNDGAEDTFVDFPFAAGKFPSVILTIANRSNTNKIIGTFSSQGTDGTIIMRFGQDDAGSASELDCIIRIRPNSGGIEIVVDSLGESDYTIGTMTFDNSENVPSGVIVPETSKAFIIPDNGRHVYTIDPPEIVDYFIQGTVESGGTPLERDIYIFDGNTMDKVFTTRSDVNGDFSQLVSGNTPYCIVVRDEGENPKNSILFDRVYGAIL